MASHIKADNPATNPIFQRVRLAHLVIICVLSLNPIAVFCVICFSNTWQYYVINLSHATNFTIIFNIYSILNVCCRIANQKPSKYKVLSKTLPNT